MTVAYYLKKEHIDFLKEKAKKEDRSISYILQKIIEKEIKCEVKEWII